MYYSERRVTSKTMGTGVLNFDENGRGRTAILVRGTSEN